MCQLKNSTIPPFSSLPGIHPTDSLLSFLPESLLMEPPGRGHDRHYRDDIGYRIETATADRLAMGSEATTSPIELRASQISSGSTSGRRSARRYWKLRNRFPRATTNLSSSKVMESRHENENDTYKGEKFRFCSHPEATSSKCAIRYA